MKQFYVYETKCLINGKKYIGSHYGLLNDSYIGSGTILQKSIAKYGRANFTKNILESNISCDSIFNRELFWINFFNAVNDIQYYNISDKPGGGFNYRSSTKFDIKERKKILKRWWRGIKRSRAHAAFKNKQIRALWSDDKRATISSKLSDSMIAWWKSLSLEKRKKFLKNRTLKLRIKIKKHRKLISIKQSAAQKRRWKKYTVEQREIIGQKISASQKGKVINHNTRQKISNTLKSFNKQMNPDKRASIDKKKSIAMSSTLWYNNGTCNRRLAPDNELVMSGQYVRGRLPS